MASEWNGKGVIPALTLPVEPNLSLDEQALRRLAHWLTSFKGISARMTNGHTGERRTTGCASACARNRSSARRDHAQLAVLLFDSEVKTPDRTSA